MDLPIKTFIWLDALEEIKRLESLTAQQMEKFSPPANPFPFECDQLTTLMQYLEKIANDLYQYLRKPLSIPEGVDINVYFIANDLQIIKNRAQSLEELSSRFRSICMDNTKDKSQMNRNIYFGLIDLSKILKRFSARAEPIIHHCEKGLFSLAN